MFLVKKIRDSLFWALVAGASVTLHAAQTGLTITPLEFDFGSCPSNHIVSYALELRAVAGDTVIIHSVDPGIAGAVALTSDTVLGPQDTGLVSISFPTGRLRGGFRGAPTIEDDSRDRYRSCSFRGVVEELKPSSTPVGISEVALNLSAVEPRLKRPLTVFNNTNFEVELSTAYFDKKVLQVPTGIHIGAHETATLAVTYAGKLAPETSYTSFTLEATWKERDSRQNSRITIAVVVNGTEADK